MSTWGSSRRMRCRIRFSSRFSPGCEEFASEWGAAWAQYGTDDDGLPVYRQLIERAKADLTAINGGGRLVLNNQVHLYLALENLIFVSALDQPQPARHDTASAAA